MVEDGDDIVSLPVPPPPRPAARREAIEAALNKFDGIEPAPARREPLGSRWSAMNRRPVGALVAVGLVAIIAIPAIQVALRDQPPAEIGDTREPAPAQPAAPALPRVVADKSLDSGPAEAIAAEEAATPAQAPASPPVVSDERSGFASADREDKADRVAPAPARIAPAPPAMVAAPPPPPPPPAARRAAEPQAQAEKSDMGGSENIVVTGSLIRSPNLESATPVAVVDPVGEFLSRLQSGFRANDRRAVARLVGFPLGVDFGGETRTYRSARDVERDFDRIFTAGVRRTALTLRPDTLTTRDGGRLKGSGGLWFGCARKTCARADEIRIREIRP